jgi:acetyl-CoA carboxylase biotin carboxyl carrier protein
MTTPGRSPGKQENAMSLDHEDVREILAIIDRTPAKEVIVEHGDLKVIIRRGEGASVAPVTEAAAVTPGPAPIEPAPAEAALAADAGLAATAEPAVEKAPPSSTAVAVTAPLTGTFYRASAPGAEPFVAEGAMVDETTTLCILEVMKVMNTLKAPCAGTVVRIDAANEQAVTAGQALIWVEPG